MWIKQKYYVGDRKAATLRFNEREMLLISKAKKINNQ